VVDQVDTSIRANPNLKPEKSRSFALGFVAQPVRNFAVQVDWFDIEKRDRVGTSLQYLIDHPDAIVAGRKASDYITRTPTTDGSLGAIELAESPYFNVGKERSVGIELGLTYRTEASAFGRLTFDNQASYFTKYTKSQAPGEPELSYLGLMDQPRYKNVFSVSYDQGDYSVTGYWRTLGGFLDTQEPTEVTGSTPRVGAWSTVDLQFAVRSVGVKGSRIAFGVKNLFDKAPVSSANDNNSGFPTSHNGVGRFVYVNFAMQF
jgi:iron complex outermembrane receptor protein